MWASVSAMAGFHSRASWGSSWWRMRLRAKSRVALVASSRHGMPRSRRKSSDLRALDVDQRADDAASRDRPDGGQSGGAAAAQEAKEHGFGLVGAGVSERDPRRESAREVIVEEGEARVARGLLQIARRGGEIEIVERERKIERGGETADKLGVAARGVAAKVVVDVQHAERQVPARCQFEQHVQQADGIGAAGDGDRDAIARREHAMALDGMDNPLRAT